MISRIYKDFALRFRVEEVHTIRIIAYFFALVDLTCQTDLPMSLRLYSKLIYSFTQERKDLFVEDNKISIFFKTIVEIIEYAWLTLW